MTSGKLWIGSEANLATEQPTIAVANLPNLKQGTVWQGDANNRPVEVTIAIAPIDARYILQQPDSSLSNAQSLNQLIGLDPKILKTTADGVIEVAIPDTDYATLATLEELAAEAQASADAAATSAEGASASATAAATSATEATGAATAATGSATAAAGSATLAGASAIAASLSAGSASSSASDASTSATNAANSATSATASLNTLLHTGITLQGDVYGSGGLLNPITLSFSDNPVLPGAASATLPGGTTAQRPLTLTAGMIRFNSGS